MADNKTYFCENGHIVPHLTETGSSIDKKFLVCSVCKSHKLMAIDDWDNKSDIVPHEPVAQTKKRYSVNFNVYDVKRLFKKEEK